MIPYDADPSLHPAQPVPPQLDDGFSPPHEEVVADADDVATQPVDPALWTKSEF